VVLLSTTLCGSFVCRNCWATIGRSSKKDIGIGLSGFTVGFAGVSALGVWKHVWPLELLEMPFVIAYLCLRLFGSLEVLEAALAHDSIGELAATEKSIVSREPDKHLGV
jgi:hypothetical protein